MPIILLIFYVIWAKDLILINVMSLVSLCSHAFKKRVTIAYCMIINNNNNNNDNGDNDDDGFQVQKHIIRKL